jgi:cysteine desulfurase
MSGPRNSPVYLDANATEPLRPAARAALVAALGQVGNPSSVHGSGRAARRVLEDAREAIARRFGGEVVFTSGGTEADALAIHALGDGRRLLIGATEHDAIRAARPDAMLVPVDGDGRIDLQALAAMLEGSPSLVCLMLANNETGTIQPVAEAAAICRRFGARLHVDAVQAAGRMPVDLSDLGADSLAISSHKLGGPAGAGALILASDFAGPALIVGGGQERGRRGGTPAVAVIAGFAAALEAEPLDLIPLRHTIEDAATGAGGIVLGGPDRLPNTVSIGLPGVAAQTQLIALDLAGIHVSAGAACSSGKVARSHVLDAMGLGALAGEAIRVSLPWNATPADADAFAVAYAAMARRLYRGARVVPPLVGQHSHPHPGPLPPAGEGENNPGLTAAVAVSV